MKLRHLLVTLPLLGGGCTSLAADLQALAGDRNAVCIRITTLWGSGELNRNHGCEPGVPAPVPMS